MQSPSDRADAIARAAAGELLGAHDMAAIWRISVSRFHALNRQRAFDLFKVSPPIGPRCYSGVLVHRHLCGEKIDATPSRSYFGRSKKAS